jgi:hypothetical protein
MLSPLLFSFQPIFIIGLFFIVDVCGAVFKLATAFDGDLSAWEVGKVTDMFESKCRSRNKKKIESYSYLYTFASIHVLTFVLYLFFFLFFKCLSLRRYSTVIFRSGRFLRVVLIFYECL